MAISFVAAGIIWKFMYEFRPAGSPQIGTVNAFLHLLLPTITVVDTTLIINVLEVFDIVYVMTR